MQFYYISIFTSVIVMGIPLIRGLQLVVFVVVIVHILSLAILLAWDNPRLLFGKGNHILNRYSSTHTMHTTPSRSGHELAIQARS
jgi:hypothetical protein